MAQSVDMSGDTLYVNDVVVNSTTPGNLSGTGFAGYVPALANYTTINSARCIHTGGQPMISATSPGVSTIAASTNTYVAEVYVPNYVKLNGVAIYNYATAGGNVTIYLLANNGVSIANSTSTAVSGTSTYQRVACSFAALPPGTYYIAAQFSSATNTFATHVTGDFGTVAVGGSTFGILPTVTAPTTFTSTVGLVASLY